MNTKNINLRKDHEAVRNEVGFYDFTHELLEVTGLDAKKFLDKLFVARISKLEVNSALYTTMLNEEGIVIDDVIIFQIDENKFWISTLYINQLIKWFDNYKKDFNIEYEDITSKTTMYAVQGPKSKKVLNAFLDKNIDSLKVFNIMDNKIDNIPVKIARAGFTGELGYEIYCDPKDKKLVENKLYESGKDFNILNITTDVIIMSLPAEKGYILMSDIEGTNPFESDLDWSIDWNSDFIGKKALEKIKNQEVKRKLLGFTVDDDNAEIEPGAIVTLNGKEIGKVTKFTYGFTVEKNIGYALVNTSSAKINDIVIIKSKDKEIEAKLTRRKFYDLNDDRIKG